MPNPPEQILIPISFTLNGQPVSLSIPPSERLLDTLRDRLHLTGTKEGCGEGECGACTILLDGLPANSCLLLTAQINNQTVETIEHVSNEEVLPFLDSGGTQCGACTPGVIMCAKWIRNHPHLQSTHSLRELMAGNLCRCTGYDGIIEGLQNALDQPEPSP